MSVNGRRNRWSSQKHIDSPPLVALTTSYLVSDKCLFLFWFIAQLCWVHAGWGPTRHINTQWGMHPLRRFIPEWWSAGASFRSTLSWHFISRFVCLLIFIWSLDKNQSQCCQKAKSSPHSLSWKGQSQSKKVCRSCALDMLDVVFPCACLPLLLEAWVSASFGVRKRRGSLSGLVPDMLMDWTCTM